LLYVFIRGQERKTCETRLSADGEAFELVDGEEGVEHDDRFSTIGRLKSREHELLQEWLAQGWTQPSQAKR
jgi:hypothetical protein